MDRLSADLSERYIQYLETFMVDLWSEASSSFAPATPFAATTNSDHLQWRLTPIPGKLMPSPSY